MSFSGCGRKPWVPSTCAHDLSLQREAKGFRTLLRAGDAAYLSPPSESRALSTVGLELDGRSPSAAARAPEPHRPSCSRAGPRAPADASVQFSSVTQSRPTLCDPMNRSTPGLPVHLAPPSSSKPPL